MFSKATIRPTSEKFEDKKVRETKIKVTKFGELHSTKFVVVQSKFVIISLQNFALSLLI